MVPPRACRGQANGATTHHEKGGRPDVVRCDASRHPSRICRALARTIGAESAGAAFEGGTMDLIWIIVIVLIVLALLGYFGRGRFR